jgi:hemerythrin-like domain-containing protein
MLPTQILENEHRIIEQVLSCLSKMVLDVTKDGKFDKEMASDAVDFFRNFADKCHHGKEEVHLFPMIEARQMPGSCGPTNVMRMEHDLGREHVRGMADAIEAASKGDEDAIFSWTNHAKQFIMLLRDHIMKEDQILYPMANQYFTDGDQAELSAKFEKVEEEEMGKGTHEKYIGIANKLAEKYGVKVVPEADTSQHAHHCCGH